MLHSPPSFGSPLHKDSILNFLRRALGGLALLTVCDVEANNLQAEDWPQFRGPRSNNVSADQSIPTRWSETENLAWQVDLPGAGSSSPIVIADRVYVTCYSGYGVPSGGSNDLQKLTRHLVAINRMDGKILWNKTVPAEQPEDSYQGFISEHGYASGTPVSDGERIYCFFGKSGVVAFDRDGKQLWQTNVGKDSSSRRWGSGSSLLLFKDSVIVNASEESLSIRALDKLTGKEQWKAAGSALELTYATPVAVTMKSGETDIVLAVPGEIWGLNPSNGKLRWFAEHSLTGNISPSVIVDGEQLFIFGGFRSSGSLAMKVGGEGDVTKSSLVWTSRNSSYVATPALHGGHLYWIDDRGSAHCVDAKSGELVYRERVSELSSGGRPVYASPVVIGDKIYVTSRYDGTFVLPARPQFEVLARNQFASDKSDFNPSPAVSDGQLFIRSNRRLYCVAKK